MHPDYERFINGIHAHVPDAKVIVDVGALDGAGAIDIKRAFPDATVFAVDPINLNVDACLAAGVVPVIACCSSHYGNKMFTRSRQSGLTSMYSRGIEESGGFMSVSFPVSLLVADAVKIDAEGSAYEIVFSAASSRLIQVETETAQLFAGQVLEAECFEQLTAFGFRRLWEERSGEQTESMWLR